METGLDYNPLLAAYLNMARNNCAMAIGHITEKVYGGIKDVEEDSMQDSGLLRKLKSNELPDMNLHVIKMLDHHFPFLKAVLQSRRQNEDMPEDYYQLLYVFILQLNELRNFYTHYLHRPYHVNEEVIHTIKFLFDLSRREVRKRFNLTEADVKHLVRKKLVIVKGQREIQDIPDFAYALTDKDTKSFTLKGIAFFTCLWLERKQAFLFLKQLKGFKSSINAQHKATLETFCYNHIRLPQPKIISDDSNFGLMLDMLEELKRCPTNLYEHLSPQNQQRFKTVDDTEQPDVVLKRSTDRFPYFALKYLEVTKSLPVINFQVDLGNHYFKIYEKTVDGEKRIRRLAKPMKGFGHPADFKIEAMPKDWTSLVKSTDQLEANHTEPYIPYTEPHYHFINNQIGISIGQATDKEKLLDSKKMEPMFWLSLYELPALIFYQLLAEDDRKFDRVSAIISNHKKAITGFFKDLSNGVFDNGLTERELLTELEKRGLKITQIPKPLLEYLRNDIPTNAAIKKAEYRLRELIEETDYRLERLSLDLERSKEKPGSKKYRPIQSGLLAEFMAKDMMLMQPPVDMIKGKATGTLFQVLQARLAFYSRDKHLLQNIYKECNLIESKNAHPFLNNITLTHLFTDYYRNYLIKRKVYLEECLKKCLMGRIGSQSFHFLHLGEREKRADKAYYKTLAAKLISAPINLPRGLFMKKIIDYFKQSDDETLNNIVNTAERANTNYLIKAYNELKSINSSQDFYNWPRTYKAFNIKKQTSKKPAKPEKRYLDTTKLTAEAKKLKESFSRVPAEDGLLIKEQLKYYDDNEKELRLNKACDTLMFLMAKRLLASLESSVFGGLDIKKLKLKDVAPDAEKEILSTTATITLPLQGENTIKNIIHENVKLKNYGDLRRFMKDRRLKSLLPYYPDDNIKKSTIEKELDSFDQVRIDVHQLILEFEKTAAIKYNIPINPIDGFTSFKTILSAIPETDLSIQKRDWANSLRNAFSHNQYPSSDVFKSFIQTASTSSTIAQQLFALAQTTFVLP